LEGNYLGCGREVVFLMMGVFSLKRVREVLRAGFDELNRFYECVESDIRECLRRGDIEKMGDLLEVRLYSPLVSLYLIWRRGLLSGCSGLPSRERLAEVRRVALCSVLEGLGLLSENEVFSSIGDRELFVLARGFLECLKRGCGEELGERIVRLQLFEVGGKQALVSRTGGFADMRGASAMIDIASKLAADAVSEILGSEFLLSSEAGETVFLSPPEIAGSIEEAILRDYVLNHEKCPYLDVLLFRGNGASGIDVSVEDLLKRFGQVFLAALLTLRDLNLDEGEERLEARFLCRNCRNDRGLESDALLNFARRVVSSSSQVNDVHLAVMGGHDVLCKTCYVTRLYAKALIDILSGEGRRYRERFVECLKKSSAYRVLVEAVDEAKREFYKNYVYNLEEYDYDGKLAIFGLVYGDGDRFGTLKKSTRNIFDFYFLSLFFSELMGRGVKEGFSRVLDLDLYLAESMKLGKYLVPVTPLFVAGDDFLLGIRGEYVYVFVKGYYEGARRVYDVLRSFLKLPYFSDDMRKLLEERIGVSMGVAVGKTKVPGVFLYDASRRALRFTKEVTKRSGKKFKFGVQASLIYSKARASWDLVDKLTRIPPGGSEIYDQLFSSLIYFNDEGECPVSLALKEALCRSEGRIKGDYVKEIMEEFLTEGRHPLMAFAKVLSDIARGLRGEREEAVYRAENMKRVMRIFVRACKINEHSWRWFYTIASILDIIEDRESVEGIPKEGVVGRPREFEYEILKRFVGC